MKKLLFLCVLIGLVAYFVTAGVPFTGQSESSCELTIAITNGGHVTQPGDVLEVGEAKTFRFDSGTVVNLEAVAESGYSFLNWTGNSPVASEVVGTGNGTQTEWSLANQHVIEDSETIYIDGAEQTKDTDYAIDYDASVISFTTAPENGSLVTADYRWADPTGVATVADVTAAATTITLDADYFIIANFVDASSTAILTVDSTEGGSVTEPGENAFAYDPNTEVTLVAEPDDGYTFINWNGDVDTVDDVTATTTTITMDADYSITANFGATYTLSVSSTDGGSVTKPGEGNFTYGEGSVVPLVAEADEGSGEYVFVNWTGDVNTIGNAVELEDVGSGDGSQTEWTLTNIPVLEDSETVYVGGVEQTRGTDYSIDYITGEITFTAAPENNEPINVDYFYLDATAEEASIAINGDYAITANFSKWVARYDGDVSDVDQAVDMTMDSEGNIYVTGWSYGGDPALDPANTARDYATMKYDSDLNELWDSAARYNNDSENGEEWAAAIAVDSAGNVYVTGRSEGTGTSYDCTTVKYNSAGDQQWVARYDGALNGWDQANAIAVYEDGSNVYVYVTGYTSMATYYDYITIGYNGDSGTELWASTYDGPLGGWDDDAKAIAVDQAGNVYVTGTSMGSGTLLDYATVKYNSAGAEQWVARYDGPGNDYDEANAIAVDSSGNAYVTGKSKDTSGDYDYATVKYNSSGAQQWVARYDGSAGSDVAYAIALDGSGNAYVTGYSEDSNADYATVKYNNAGAQQWVARYDGGVGSDVAYAIALDGNGNVYVTGKSEGEDEDDDYATLKYDAATGQELWDTADIYDGSAGEDRACAIVVDSAGSVYVTGSSVGIGTNYDYVTLRIIQ